MKTHTGQPKVLIVDDDPDFLFDLKTWLTHDGFKAHTAEVGRTGIQRFRLYRPYAVVILDLHMPKIDGFDVLKEIKAIDIKAKVVVLTGDASARDRAEALGADAFIVKPVGRTELSYFLRKVIRNERGTVCRN